MPSTGAGRPGPAWCLRADFDALPIPDESGAPCLLAVPAWATSAHDGFTARPYMPRPPGGPPRSPRTVYFLFQNAEETGTGQGCLALLEREPVEAV